MKIIRVIILLMVLTLGQSASAENLDSIPYLMDHARKGESWAFENLARCFRYGIGVEKSIVNAMVYYDKSDIDEIKLAENAYTSDPADELGLMNHIMNGLSKRKINIKKAVKLLKSYPKPLPDWAAFMIKLYDNRNIKDLEGFINTSFDEETPSADVLTTSSICLMALRPNTPSFYSRPSTQEYMDRLKKAAGKIPEIYNMIGDRYLDMYHENPTDEQALKNAFEMYHSAYLYGLLDSRGAVEVLDYRDNHPLYSGFPFSPEEVAQLDGLYSKEFRTYFKSACVEVEEEVGVKVEEDEAAE